MQEQIPTLCTCRNRFGEPTRLGRNAYLLAKFRQERPGVGISEFFDEYGIDRMCCRLSFMSPYHVRLESQTDVFKSDSESTFSVALTQNLDHLLIVPNQELEFPK